MVVGHAELDASAAVAAAAALTLCLALLVVRIACGKPVRGRTSDISVQTIRSAAFNGAHCEAGWSGTQNQADDRLQSNPEVYIGFMTLDSEPGVHYFARLGASFFSEATGKPSAGCTVSVLTGSSGGRGQSEPVIASRRTEYMLAGQSRFLPRCSLFSDGAGTTSACECVEGGVGSCWLVAAMASLAAHEGVIRRLFGAKARGHSQQQQQQQQQQQYTVTLHSADGAACAVAVDESLPACRGADGDYLAAYAKPGDAVGDATVPTLWPCLLEKACAASGIFADGGDGYEGLNGGDPARALQALTGAVATTHETSDMTVAALDALIAAKLQSGTAAIVLASRVFDATAACDVVARGGVQQDHAYSLLAARPLLLLGGGRGRGDGGGGGAPLHEFQLRNPWGRVGLATPGQPLRDPKTNGLFWMAASTIAELFVTVYVVHDIGGSSLPLTRFRATPGTWNLRNL